MRTPETIVVSARMLRSMAYYMDSDVWNQDVRAMHLGSDNPWISGLLSATDARPLAATLHDLRMLPARHRHPWMRRQSEAFHDFFGWRLWVVYEAAESAPWLRIKTEVHPVLAEDALLEPTSYCKTSEETYRRLIYTTMYTEWVDDGGDPDIALHLAMDVLGEMYPDWDPISDPDELKRYWKNAP